MTSSVLTEVLSGNGSNKIAIATLNKPDTLNGLSLQMCHELTKALAQWEQDPDIKVIILRGAGDRAFCAGGDLHGLYSSMLENTGKGAWDNAYTREFFDVEYRLDYQIHTYSKPIMCWGNGIVMGGGVGLMMGASHRVVTDTTRFAMPEITIGLFPDVGGTWMLSRLPNGIGNFLALTGSQLGASDCIMLDLADFSVHSEHFQSIVNELLKIEWSEERTTRDLQLQNVLQSDQFTINPDPGPLKQHYDLIRKKCSSRDFMTVCENIKSFAEINDPWMQRAAKTFTAGAPGSARLSYELLKRVKHLSLADVFRLEYIVSLNCGVQGDFQEGIRALLIDKDRTPKWNPSTLEEATQQWVQLYFKEPWPAETEHPLADLAN